MLRALVIVVTFAFVLVVFPYDRRGGIANNITTRLVARLPARAQPSVRVGVAILCVALIAASLALLYREDGR